MDHRLQAGLELQLDKQAQQEHDSSLSGVLSQHFKQAGHEKTAIYRKKPRSTWDKFKDKITGKEHDPFYRPPGFNLPPDAIERKPIPMPEPPGLPQRPDDWRDVMPRYPGLPKEQPTIGGKISSVYKDILRKAQEFQKRNREKRYREYIQEYAPGKEPTPGETTQGMPGLRDILR